MRPKVVVSSFPDFCTEEVGSKIKSLKNYYLPDFILSLVAKKCDSELAEKGKIEKKLRSMNEKSIELLYKIFVNRTNDISKDFEKYRFYAYVSSMYYKCVTATNEKMVGKSEKSYIVPAVVKNNGMYISIAFNKNSEKKVNKRDIEKFYNIVDDIKSGADGSQLTDAIFCSSIGFNDDAVKELENFKNARGDDPESKLNFKLSHFENGIYSLI